MEERQPLREFPTWKAARRKFAANNAFFVAGNVERELLAKQVSLEISEDEEIAIKRMEEEQAVQLHCPIVGCGVQLKRIADFEAHHATRHTAACSVCSNVFPTSRLLNLHISEIHDSFFKAKVARSCPMYECLVEGCPGLFHTDSSRLQHLVDKHQFPRSFRFNTKNHHLSQHQRQRKKQLAYQQPSPTTRPLSKKQQGKLECEHKENTVAELELIDPAESDNPLLGQVPHSQIDKNQTSGQETKDTLAMDVENLTSGISRLSTVSQSTDLMPTVVSFGRRRSRGSMSTQTGPKHDLSQRKPRKEQLKATPDLG